MVKSRFGFEFFMSLMPKKSHDAVSLKRNRRRSKIAMESLENRAVMAGSDLSVSLKIAGETLTNGIVQQYSAVAIKNPNSSAPAGWAAFDSSGNATRFSYLETHQFPVPSQYANGTAIDVKITEHDGNGIPTNRYPGFAAFFKGQQLKNGSSSQFAWGQEIKGLRVNHDAPVHLTIIPFNAANGVYMPQKAYAIWLSPRTTNSSAVNHLISKDLGWTSPDSRFAEAGLVRPQWRYSASTNTLKFIGSLDRYNEFDGVKGDLHGKDVSLTLGDAVSVDIPLTNSFAVIKLPPLTDAQRNVVQKLNGKSDLSSLTDNELGILNRIAITERANYLKIEKPKLASKVHINGLGRINGYSTYKTSGAPPIDLNDFSSIVSKKNELKTSASLLDEIYTGQYMIRSGLAEIHSTKSIVMEGVSVSYGPIRHQEFIQLASDETVSMFDVKTPGAFRGASDGPGILSPRATAKYLYLMHEDDAIKVFADEQHFSDVTLIQGNAGAAIDLGAYGYNKAIVKGSTVSNVYVHRIMQLGAGYDGLGGVITTRNKATGPEISNVTISGVYIADLGPKGPNRYFRKTAIGFVPGGYFSGSDPRKKTMIRNLTINPFSGLAPVDQQNYDFAGSDPSTPYYKRGKGRLWYNLGERQRNAFPSDQNFPQTPSGKQYGVFDNLKDNS